MGKRKATQQQSKSATRPAAVTPSSLPREAFAMAPRGWALWLLAALLLVVVTFAVYAPSMRGPFIFDDLPKIVENPDIKDWNNIWSKLVYPYDAKKSFKRNDPSRPVVYLTLAWNYHLGKLNPLGYHLLNVAVHAANALLIWAVAHLLWFAAFRRRNFVFPFLAGLLFAVHPLNTTTVSYIFSRSDVLSTFFYLSSLLLFALAFMGERRKYLAYAASLLCFIPAFYAKQLAATLPAVILLFDLVFLSNFRWRDLRPRAIHHAAYWVMLAVFLIGRYQYFGALGDLEAKTPLPAGLYLMSQASAIAKYLQMMLVPVGMCIDHAVSPETVFFSPKVIFSWLLMFGIVAGLITACRKRTDTAKLVVFFIGWFIITLAPTSSFLPTTAVLVDNRSYLPGLGWVGMMTLGYAILAGRQSALRTLILVIALLHVGILGALCANRNTVYRSTMSVWQDAVNTYPENPRAHVIIAQLYKEQGDDEKAIEEYRKVIELDPDRPNAHNNLASIYYGRREVDKAIVEYEAEVRIAPDEPLVRKNLANALYSQGRLPEAIEHYRKAIELDPENMKAHFELGTLYLELKDYASATPLLEKASELDPNNAPLLNNLGVGYLNSGNAQKALDTFLALQKIAPTYAHLDKNLAKARRALGQPKAGAR